MTSLHQHHPPKLYFATTIPYIFLLFLSFPLLSVVQCQFDDPLAPKKKATQAPPGEPARPPGEGIAPPTCEQRDTCGLGNGRDDGRGGGTNGGLANGAGAQNSWGLLNATSMSVFHRNCFCDDLCFTYEDCCKDMYTRRTSPGSEGAGRGGGGRSTPVPGGDRSGTGIYPPSGGPGRGSNAGRLSDVVACQKLDIPYRHLQKSTGMASFVIVDEGLAYIVNACPRDYEDDHVRQQCNHGRSPTDDTFLRLPVNGRRSRILYRNIYCALCNNETDVLYWTAEKDLIEPSLAAVVSPGGQSGGVAEGLQTGRGDGGGGLGVEGAGGGPKGQGAEMGTVSREVQTSQTRILFSFPGGMSPRPCKNVISSCAGDFKDERTIRQCHVARGAGTKYVYTTRGFAYRNLNCAKCNHVEEQSLRCENEIFIREGEKDPLYELPPYSLILDMNTGSGGLRDNRVGSGGVKETVREVTFTERCPDGQVYDPFTDICRIIYCTPGYHRTTAGECEPNFDESDPVDSSSDMLASITSSPRVGSLRCAQAHGAIALNRTEYEFQENGKIFVPAYDVSYGPGEYEMRHPFLFICSLSSGSAYNVTRNVTDYLVMFKFDQMQGVLSFIGVIISLASLFAQFVIYMLFPVLRNIPGKCIVCLVVALFVGQLAYMFVSPRNWFAPACLPLALIMHYGFLAAFFWMNVMAIDICRTFSSEIAACSSSSTSNRFVFYSLYAWLSPAIIVSSALTLDLVIPPAASEVYDAWDSPGSWAPRYGRGYCWITSRRALLAFFATPLGLILISNIILFIISIFYIQRASKASQPAVQSHSAGRLFLYFKLSFVMGLAWAFGFAAALTGWATLWYVFIVFNSLQGAFICLSFVCTTKVFRLVRDSGRKAGHLVIACPAKATSSSGTGATAGSRGGSSGRKDRCFGTDSTTNMNQPSTRESTVFDAKSLRGSGAGNVGGGRTATGTSNGTAPTALVVSKETSI